MRKGVRHTVISFERFEAADGLPIYQQIVIYIKRGIAAGTVEQGDELPSRRVLSALLGINPNTVQKAYRILEEEGLIASQTGAKSTVVLGDGAVERIRSQLLEHDARHLVGAMKQLGLSKAEAVRLLETYWE